MHGHCAPRFDDAAHLGSIIALAGGCRQGEATAGAGLGRDAYPNRLRLTRGVLCIGGESEVGLCPARNSRQSAQQRENLLSLLSILAANDPRLNTP